MLLQEPSSHSPYDLRFELLGFPIRVAWTFWVVGLIFGYQLVQSLDLILDQAGASPGMLPLLLLWTLCIFVSLLVHEMGHALAFRMNGIQSKIVLYHFGGLAIPTGRYETSSHSQRMGPARQIWISFAGPFAQFMSAVVLMAVVWLVGYRLSVLQLMPGPFWRIPGVMNGAELAQDSPGLFALVTFYVFPSVLWALLNLVPVWPLDGGQIMRSLIEMGGGTLVQSLWVSVIAAGLMCGYGFSNGQTYLGLLFLMLAVSSFQAINQLGGARYL